MGVVNWVCSHTVARVPRGTGQREAMRGEHCSYLIVGFLAGVVASTCPSHAQYIADYQINVISGVTSNWIDASSNPTAGYVVGSNWVDDVLLVDGGGVLSNGNGYVGYAVGADDNTVIVSDPGSVWSNQDTAYIGYSGAGNKLMIANGGAVYGGQVGYNATSSNNTAVVSGVGSTWYNVGHIGVYGSGNQLVIENGGVAHGGDLGYYGSSSNNVALVTGTGSIWYLGGAIGTYGSYNELIISNGGAAYGHYGDLGGIPDSPSGSNNIVIITGTGSVWSNTDYTCVGCGAGSNQKMMVTGGGLVYDSFGVVDWESSNNTVVVSDPGSLWKNTGSFAVGWGGYGNQMVISNGGAVYVGDSAFVGASYATSNAVFLTGNGSVFGVAKTLYVGGGADGLSSNNQLIVSNGALVYDTNGQVGGVLSGNNLVLVTGPGSVWSNSANLVVGTNVTTAGNQLVVTNGGTVYDNTGIVAGQGSRVFVGGNGATWWNQGNLYVGSYPGAGLNGGGATNTVIVGAGGSVVASDLYVSQPALNGLVNGIIMSGGSLFVTNGLHSGVLDLNASPKLGAVYGGVLTLNAGTVSVDCLVMTNYSGNSYTAGGVKFNGGVLSTKSTIISNDYSPYYFVFTVGNGTNNATLHLAPGGTGFHFFEAGLTISSNGLLTGVGTVMGTTTIKAGGTLAPGDGPGSLIFSNNLTLAAGSTLALTLNGTGAGQYSQITGLGGISVSNAVLNISLGYKPLPGDSFTIISNLTSSAILGTFVTTDGLALPNGADFVVDNTTFQIDYAANPGGMDVDLTALIPEPSSLLLTALGAATLWGVVRRRRV